MADKLVEVSDGVWVDPDDVRRVTAYGGRAPVFGVFGRVVTPGTDASVVVSYRDCTNTQWTFASWEDARDFADEIAGKINGGSPPDDPDREDIPEGRDGEGGVVVSIWKAEAA